LTIDPEPFELMILIYFDYVSPQAMVAIMNWRTTL